MRIPLLLALWYSSSVLTSLSTKAILSMFPHPVTLALVQQCIAAAFGWASLRSPRPRCEVFADTRLHWLTTQISLVMVVSLIAYRWALLGGSVAFTNTVKTLGPAFVIVFSRVLIGERLALARYAAVLPIVLGVALTSVTEAEFTWLGFVAGLVSTAASAAQSVAGKRLLRAGDIAKPELFSLAALQACILLLPLSLAIDAWRLTPLSHADALRVARWLALNGGCFFVNQYVSITVLDAMASPLSYSLANVMKRATVITMAMAYNARPVAPLHLVGVALSLLGTFIYSQVGAMCGDDDERGGGGGTRGGGAQYELVPLQACKARSLAGGGRLDGAACAPRCDTDSTSSSSDSHSPTGSPTALAAAPDVEGGGCGGAVATSSGGRPSSQPRPPPPSSISLGWSQPALPRSLLPRLRG